MSDGLFDMVSHALVRSATWVHGDWGDDWSPVDKLIEAMDVALGVHPVYCSLSCRRWP